MDNLNSSPGARRAGLRALLHGVPGSSGFPWRGDPHGDRGADNRERADREWESVTAGAVEEKPGEWRPDKTADPPTSINEAENSAKIPAVEEIRRDYRQL